MSKEDYDWYLFGEDSASLFEDLDVEGEVEKLFEEYELPSEKCECGGDKCKTPHSSWCPKYKKD